MRGWVTTRLLRRTAVLFASAFVLVTLMAACGGEDNREAGKTATTQTANTTGTSTTSDASGRVIDGRFAVGADRHELALRCLGKGSPTVILEAGADSSGIEQFAGLADRLATLTMTCAYDRVGTGTSDPPSRPRRTIDEVVADLHALVDAAKVPGPYLLVGQSGGGNIAAYYAGRYPDRVAGVILLDVGRPTGTLGKEFPGRLGWKNPEHIDWVALDRDQARHPSSLGNIPLVVVSATHGQTTAKDTAFWLRRSSHSRQTRLAGGHDIHDENPEGVVAEVESTLDAVRD
jgi:pimeloyl-ACP methyl ester carboxylesterase